MIVDKNALIQYIEEQNKAIGFVPDPNATGEQAQEMTRALGIAPSDNILSYGIISARDENEQMPGLRDYDYDSEY